MSAVLLVDDSPADRALFRTILGRGGVRGPRGRLRAARRWPGPARSGRTSIVLDVNLPDTDGHAVCRALRADPQFAGVPILMLTVRDHEDDVLAGLEAGADDYLAKDEAPADHPGPGPPAGPVPPDGDRLGPQRAARAGRPAGGRDRPRDPRPARR